MPPNKMNYLILITKLLLYEKVVTTFQLKQSLFRSGLLQLTSKYTNLTYCIGGTQL